MERLLTLTEVHQATRTPIETLRYWRTQGTGPRSFKLGRRIVYRECDVETWIAERMAAERRSA